MRKTAALVGLVATLTVFAACKKDDPPPATQANAAQPGQPGYYQPQPGQPGYQPQPGYPPQPGQPGYPPQPGQPQAGQLAVPGPAALPCQNDSMCMTHKCNTQYQKCAFPCETDNDCIQGAYCFKGPVPACVPKAPGQQ